MADKEKDIGWSPSYYEAVYVDGKKYIHKKDTKEAFPMFPKDENGESFYQTIYTVMFNDRFAFVQVGKSKAWQVFDFETKTLHPFLFENLYYFPDKSGDDLSYFNNRNLLIVETEEGCLMYDAATKHLDGKYFTRPVSAPYGDFIGVEVDGTIKFLNVKTNSYKLASTANAFVEDEFDCIVDEYKDGFWLVRRKGEEEFILLNPETNQTKNIFSFPITADGSKTRIFRADEDCDINWQKALKKAPELFAYLPTTFFARGNEEEYNACIDIVKEAVQNKIAEEFDKCNDEIKESLSQTAIQAKSYDKLSALYKKTAKANYEYANKILEIIKVKTAVEEKRAVRVDNREILEERAASQAARTEAVRKFEDGGRDGKD